MQNIFFIPKHEIDLIGFENQLYGFPLKTGLVNLVEFINSVLKKYKIKYVYGIDLGCGDGDVINYFNKYIINSEWIGIELSEYRINLSKCKDIIIEGNLLDICYGDYNFIYVNNLCFDDELEENMENKIYAEFTGFILTTNKIKLDKLLKKVTFVKMIEIDTNWQKNHIFYLFHL